MLLLGSFFDTIWVNVGEIELLKKYISIIYHDNVL